VAPALRAAPQLHKVRADPLTAVRNDALPGGASEHLEDLCRAFRHATERPDRQASKILVATGETDGVWWRTSRAFTEHAMVLIS
jgi:hypothetical protein